MCGIAGLFDPRAAWPEETARTAVAAMTARLSHRGPDAEGFWSDPDRLCHFGHRRLAIRELSAAADQPAADAGGRYALAFNGEIYNTADLRRRIGGAHASGRPPSEVRLLLSGLLRFGDDLFPMLDGMFAVAVYDRVERRLTLARDRVGEKPLYYLDHRGVVAFASEMHALTRLPGVPFALSEAGVAQFLFLRYAPAPDTVLDPIRKLEPGTLLSVGADARRTVRRYVARGPGRRRTRGPDAGEDDVLQALKASLRDRLASDVPVGVFLSGGVDSSLLLALLSRELGEPRPSFTLGFAGSDESEHAEARRISAHLGGEHHEVLVTFADVAATCEAMGALLDEPNGDRSCVPTYMLSRHARRSVAVALGGDGGDELFCGYDRYRGFLAARPPVPETSAAAVRRYFETSLPVVAANPIRDLLPDGFEAIQRFLAGAAALHACGDDETAWLGELDFATYLPGAVLAKLDRMSMRSGLEVRAPFLSAGVLAASTRLPAELRGDRAVPKRVLRRLLARYVPAEIAQAPKRGFGLPTPLFATQRPFFMGLLRRSAETLAGTRLMQGRRPALDRLVGSAEMSANAMWAVIVLGDWVAASDVRL